MSLHIWTPAALSSEFRSFTGQGWRLVECQHYVSTLKIVDSLEEQRILEMLVEETKPPLPPECQSLHFLLSTPFRYDPAYPKGSRFRRAGRTPGVYYAAMEPETAVAEIAFYRVLFFAESPGTPWPVNPAEYTAFAVDVESRSVVDLTSLPLSQGRAVWTDPVNYEPCQALAETARQAGAGMIRYKSVRDPRGRHNLALLTCQAFRGGQPAHCQTWRILLSHVGAQALCEFPQVYLAFDRDEFSSDPRLSGMDWKRPPGN